MKFNPIPRELSVISNVLESIPAYQFNACLITMERTPNITLTMCVDAMAGQAQLMVYGDQSLLPVDPIPHPYKENMRFYFNIRTARGTCHKGYVYVVQRKGIIIELDRTVCELPK